MKLPRFCRGGVVFERDEQTSPAVLIKFLKWIAVVRMSWRTLTNPSAISRFTLTRLTSNAGSSTWALPTLPVASSLLNSEQRAASLTPAPRSL